MLNSCKFKKMDNLQLDTDNIVKHWIEKIKILQQWIKKML